MSRTSAPSRTPARGAERPRPRLRLLDARSPEHSSDGDEPRQRTHAPRGDAGRVLVAGFDPAVRARMLAELRSLLPTDTDFREASETWEVIARAADSRMVVIAGDLGDTSASALLQLLARRNPSLPVLAVGADRRRLHAPAQRRGPDDGRYRRAVDAAHA